MKSIKVFMMMILLLPLASTATNGMSEARPQDCNSLEFNMLNGVTVEQVITALDDYSEMTSTYIHENLVSFCSLGYDQNNEEYGTITVDTQDGEATWNWRLSGGSNVILIWPA